MRCPRCAKQNEDGARFCSRCGLDMHSVQIDPVASDEAVKYCYRHPKRATLLSCGRCEKPICDRCVVIGPAGSRCQDCAKSNVAFRPGAVGLQFKRMFRSLTRVSPWYLIILAFMLFGFLRGCVGMIQSSRNQDRPVEIRSNPGQVPPENFEEE